MREKMPPFGLGSVLSVVTALVTSACATSQTINHPAINAYETTMADALVVSVDRSGGFGAPSNVVRGAGEGATHAMGETASGLMSGGGDSAILGILLLPIALPISAGVGAGLAHSAEEVDKARAAMTELGQDESFFQTLEQRFLDKLGPLAQSKWACIEAKSEHEREPCPAAKNKAIINFRPSFRILGRGEYDPDVELYASVVAVATVSSSQTSHDEKRVFEAKWSYREELGSFFELAANDAALMREKLNIIMDRLALRLAQDIYLSPTHETVVKVTEPSGQTYFDIPQAIVVRVEQGRNLFSAATHAVIWPVSGSFGETCWIQSIDDARTDQKFEMLPIHRRITLAEGTHNLEVACIKYPGSINETNTEYDIRVNVEAGAVYETDGRMYRKRPALGEE
jgi:hypothetical protein